MEKKYSKDREFLSKLLDIVELSDGDKKILLSPDLQGRVLTSTNGEADKSFGWLNYQLIESKKHLPHCNNYGGEDRFWLGPEGGQFSIFFPKGTDFSFAQWQTPSVIDTESWEMVSADSKEASFKKSMQLTNTSGNLLECQTNRKVTLLSNKEIEKSLYVNLSSKIKCVGFTSENSLTNMGKSEWTKDSGMLSIWVLGQFMHSESNTIIIPFTEAKGSKINDSYFGTIDADRLKTVGSVLLFKGDGSKRGKIGTPPTMTRPVIGAYDHVNGVLTVVKFSFDSSKTDYVNSMWEQQENPFDGDVVNSYNDGPLDDGSIMGPFYELETSSAAAALKPQDILVHKHTTVHITGDYEELNRISVELFGIDLSKTIL